MRHITAHSVWDGAIDEEHVFMSSVHFDNWLMDVAFAAAETGSPVAVYAMMHDHPPGECECIQYLPSLQPTVTFNLGGE